MKIRSALLAFAFAGVLGSAETLAQNAYITGGFGTVSVIATATDMVTARIPVSSYTYGVAVSPDGGKVYVTNPYYANTVSVIATANNTVIATIPVGSYPIGVALTPDGSKVYVGDYLSVAVSVIATGKTNCYGQSVAALTSRYAGLNAAAAELGFSSATALQGAILAFCGG